MKRNAKKQNLKEYDDEVDTATKIVKILTFFSIMCSEKKSIFFQAIHQTL